MRKNVAVTHKDGARGLDHEELVAALELVVAPHQDRSTERPHRPVKCEVVHELRQPVRQDCTAVPTHTHTHTPREFVGGASRAWGSSRPTCMVPQVYWMHGMARSTGAAHKQRDSWRGKARLTCGGDGRPKVLQIALRLLPCPRNHLSPIREKPWDAEAQCEQKLIGQRDATRPTGVLKDFLFRLDPLSHT